MESNVAYSGDPEDVATFKSWARKIFAHFLEAWEFPPEDIHKHLCASIGLGVKESHVTDISAYYRAADELRDECIQKRDAAQVQDDDSVQGNDSGR